VPLEVDFWEFEDQKVLELFSSSELSISTSISSKIEDFILSPVINLKVI